MKNKIKTCVLIDGKEWDSQEVSGLNIPKPKGHKIKRLIFIKNE